MTWLKPKNMQYNIAVRKNASSYSTYLHGTAGSFTQRATLTICKAKKTSFIKYEQCWSTKTLTSKSHHHHNKPRQAPTTHHHKMRLLHTQSGTPTTYNGSTGTPPRLARRGTQHCDPDQSDVVRTTSMNHKIGMQKKNNRPKPNHDHHGAGRIQTFDTEKRQAHDQPPDQFPP